MSLRGRVLALVGRLAVRGGSVAADHPSNGGITGDLAQDADPDVDESGDGEDTPEAASPGDGV